MAAGQRVSWAKGIGWVLLVLSGTFSCKNSSDDNFDYSYIISRVSLDSAGNEAADSSYTEGGPVFSSDCRYVVFYSAASNLIPDDTNGAMDIFLRDRLAGTTTRVSVTTAGAQATQYSYGGRISADGRYVVFGSFDSFGVTDNNGAEDVFFRDLVSGTTACVSLNSGGTQTGSARSMYPVVSSTGLVAFQSEAGDLISGGSSGFQIFVRTLATGTTELVSRATGSPGTVGNGDSLGPWITPDGRYVAFQSFASNLVTGDSNGTWDVFVRDRSSNTTTCVSVNSAGNPGNADSGNPAITPDGRYVAFMSQATDLVSGGANGKFQIYLRDLQAGATYLVSVDDAGTMGDGDSMAPTVSDDGRYVAFQSHATNLVTDDTNGNCDIFVRDVVAQKTIRVSTDAFGIQGDADSAMAVISPDGRYVVFRSAASNLVPGDTNGQSDVFIRLIRP